MLRLSATFGVAGIALPLLFLTAPQLYRLFSDWPEFVVAVWPTSLMLLVGGGFQLDPRGVAVCSNGMLYAAIGATLWLLFGRSPLGQPSRRQRMAREPSAEIQKSSIVALSLSSLMLIPLTILGLLNGSLLTKTAQVVATIVAVLCVKVRPVYPFAHVFARSVDTQLSGLSLVPLRNVLDAMKSRWLPVLMFVWLSFTAGICMTGVWLGATQSTDDLGWVASILWIPTTVGFTLAGTASLLWLSLHLLALRRRRLGN